MRPDAQPVTDAVPTRRRWEKKSLAHIALALIAANGVFWIILGLLTLFGDRDYRLVGVNVYDIVGGLLLVDGLLFFGVAWALSQKKPAAVYGAVALLAINIVLAFTDEVGLFDLLVVAVDLPLLALILLTRRCFRPVG